MAEMQGNIKAERTYKANLIRAAMIELDTKRALMYVKIGNDLIELNRIKHQYKKLILELDSMNEL